MAKKINKNEEVIVWDDVQENFDIKIVKNNKTRTASAFLIFKQIPQVEYSIFGNGHFPMDENDVSFEDVVRSVIYDNELMRTAVLPRMQQQINEYIDNLNK